MTAETSPRPWRIESDNLTLRPPVCFIVDANGTKVSGGFFSRADAALIVDAVNEYSPIPKLEMLADFVSDNIALVDERDRLRDALNEVCHRVSVALNCPRHETEAIELLVHDLLGIKECARAAIGGEKQ